MWPGSIASIPPGFVLCDGNNGTPDLRDRFIVGAGSIFDVGDTGGAAFHTHDFTSDGHVHSFAAGDEMQVGTDFDDETDSSQDSGTTSEDSNLPPYYALAFIMKT